MQQSLKPQDLVVALKLSVSLGPVFTYAQAAMELGLSASRVHSSVRMLSMARLITGNTREGINVNRARLLELTTHGVPYFFPPSLGGASRGMPTATALSEVGGGLVRSGEGAFVWPDSEGEARGNSLEPLHPCVITAARNDHALYKVLMAIDVLRVGSARERDLAVRFLEGNLS